MTDGIKTEEAWFTFKNHVESKITIRRFLLFCRAEGMKKAIGIEDNIEEVFTLEEIVRELARIKGMLDFEV